ncbi:dTDP-4-amino-4,6-dideoxygalactose transaminase [Shewanella japonica]|uniref:TDP-4-oxo-6-deoxy-D-glucose aminotransferase n=1 Tax=Shewanella japonica TaxID=93973 RepID=A0ABN4YCA0_9GAMM|nr:dTDP-4-amino-4,6-dideoxygalactose transaminase [Shewanella japonica]ARD21658.1 TDP-4-oxo-6-deoxy-D-glucose aminotransferase [Shewanella japonica]
MIPFNIPPCTGTEKEFILDVIDGSKMCGDGKYTNLCHAWFEHEFGCIRALLTPSCTAALEMAAILIDIKPDDEVIMPSYTFVSTANAFILRGAKIVFVDIRPDTMNIDENLIEQAITRKTKAIVPVHYAGVACEMDTIMKIAEKFNLWVIEDAAQGVMSTYKERPLGTIGHIGCYSFHETKNYSSGGEGGAIIINDSRFVERAEIIREKGTNRRQFLDGAVDKYTWVDIGSSFLPSELQAAYLYGQLTSARLINDKRLMLWSRYYEGLYPLVQKGFLEIPTPPIDCKHNAHMFYIKLNDKDVRKLMIEYLGIKNIQTVFHYIPLHSSPGGLSYSVFNGDDKYTTEESLKLVRLPMFYSLTVSDVDNVIEVIKAYFETC